MNKASATELQHNNPYLKSYEEQLNAALLRGDFGAAKRLSAFLDSAKLNTEITKRREEPPARGAKEGPIWQ